MMNHVQLVIDSLVGTTCKDTKIFDKYYDLDLRYQSREEYERISDTEYYSRDLYLETTTGIVYAIDVYHNEETEMVTVTHAGMSIE